jgi:hypothetical protein
LLEATGRGDDYEGHFERQAHARGLDLDIVGHRPTGRRGLLAPIRRILSV